MYAVVQGAYIGEHLVLIEHSNGVGHFLSMPDLKIRDIKQADFIQGIKSDILDPIDTLPKDVMNACIQQYNIIKRKTS